MEQETKMVFIAFASMTNYSNWKCQIALAANLAAVKSAAMYLKKFKLVKNRQRPDFCYAYELKTDERKYSIFTMNGGQTFLASVEEPRLDGRWYSEFSETHNTVEECLEALGRFNCR